MSETVESLRLECLDALQKLSTVKNQLAIAEHDNATLTATVEHQADEKAELERRCRFLDASLLQTVETIAEEKERADANWRSLERVKGKLEAAETGRKIALGSVKMLTEQVADLQRERRFLDESIARSLETAAIDRERAEKAEAAFALQPTTLENESFREQLRSQLIRHGMRAADRLEYSHRLQFGYMERATAAEQSLARATEREKKLRKAAEPFRAEAVTCTAIVPDEWDLAWKGRLKVRHLRALAAALETAGPEIAGEGGGDG